MLTKLSNKLFSSPTLGLVEDHSPLYGSLWEKNDDAWKCRSCGKPFQAALNSRHHCRSCACCYCDSCTPLRDSESNSVVISAKSFTSRYPKQFVLSKGEKSSIDRPDVTPPVSGLFEIKNKTNEVVAVKLSASRMDKTWSLLEMTRPSFMVILPGECLHCTFDPRENKDAKMDIVILHSNPIPKVAGTRVVWDTRGQGVSAESISSCAFIPKFEAASSFKVFAHDRNALLKIQDTEDQEGLSVSTRLGNGVDRIGVLQRINGHRFAGNKVDFDTNCTLVKSVVSVL